MIFLGNGQNRDNATVLFRGPYVGAILPGQQSQGECLPVGSPRRTMSVDCYRWAKPSGSMDALHNLKEQLLWRKQRHIPPLK